MNNVICRSGQETVQLGRNIAGKLKPGDIVGLSGSLGAGKTTLTKGIAEGLQIADSVTSPTFTLMCAYSGNLPLYHFDCYRMESEEELEMIGADEFLFGGGVSVLEWYEKIEHFLPEDIIKVHLEINGGGDRIITIKGLEL